MSTKIGRPAISKQLRLAALLRDKNRCRCCGVSSRHARLVMGHRVAVANGGATTLENLITLCDDCNAAFSSNTVPNRLAAPAENLELVPPTAERHSRRNFGISKWPLEDLALIFICDRKVRSDRIGDVGSRLVHLVQLADPAMRARYTERNERHLRDANWQNVLVNRADKARRNFEALRFEHLLPAARQKLARALSLL